MLRKNTLHFSAAPRNPSSPDAINIDKIFYAQKTRAIFVYRSVFSFRGMGGGGVRDKIKQGRSWANIQMIQQYSNTARDRAGQSHLQRTFTPKNLFLHCLYLSALKSILFSFITSQTYMILNKCHAINFVLELTLNRQF